MSAGAQRTTDHALLRLAARLSGARDAEAKTLDFPLHLFTDMCVRQCEEKKLKKKGEQNHLCDNSSLFSLTVLCVPAYALFFLLLLLFAFGPNSTI